MFANISKEKNSLGLILNTNKRNDTLKLTINSNNVKTRAKVIIHFGKKFIFSFFITST